MVVTKSSLPATVTSPHDLAVLILEVKAYASWYMQYTTASKVSTAYTKEQPELSAIARDLIHQWNNEKKLTPTRLEEAVAQLEKTAKNAPSLSITLAAPAPAEVKQQLVAWARANLHPDMLVYFQFNRTILGGMVVRVGSAIYDWSFRRQLLEHRSAFAEVLNRV